MPVFESQFAVVIAAKTGLSVEQVRWELPLWRAWPYYHAARVMEGERFRWPGGEGRVKRWVRKVREWVRGRQSAK